MKTITINTNKEITSFFYFNTETKEEYKVNISEGGEMVQTWQHGKRPLDDNEMSCCLYFEHRFRTNKYPLTAREVRQLCEDWKQYNIILCYCGDIDVSGSDVEGEQNYPIPPLSRPSTDYDPI